MGVDNLKEFVLTTLSKKNSMEIFRILNDKSFTYGIKERNLRDILISSIRIDDAYYNDIYEWLAHHYIPEILDELIYVESERTLKEITIRHGEYYNHKLLDRGNLPLSVIIRMIDNSVDESVIKRIMKLKYKSEMLWAFIDRNNPIYILELLEKGRLSNYDKIRLTSYKNAEVLSKLLEDSNKMVVDSAKKTIKENPELWNLYILNNSMK